MLNINFKKTDKMNEIIWKDGTVTYKNKSEEVVTEKLKKFDGNKGFIMPKAYLDALKSLEK